MELFIEKTDVAYLRSFPCVVVKKTFQVTRGVASFQIQKLKLILFCRVPGVLADLDPPSEGYKTALESKWLCIVCKPLDSKRLRNC